MTSPDKGEHKHPKEFATQVQERLQKLACMNPETRFSTGFNVQFEDGGPEFEMSVGNLSKDEHIVAFNYTGIYGSLELKGDKVGDIWRRTYENPEALFVNWADIASDENVPIAVRMIAKRMQELIDNPEQASRIDANWVNQVIKAIWQRGQEIGSPIMYISNKIYEAPTGAIEIQSRSDMSSGDDSLPDSNKSRPDFLIRVMGSGGFTYVREVTDGRVAEKFIEYIDPDALLPLTQEEQEDNPYLVGDGQWARVEGEILFDENGNSVKVIGPTGYAVLHVRDEGGYTVLSTHKTKKSAELEAAWRYQMELARNRSKPTDISPERQQRVIGALDAALFVANFDDLAAKLDGPETQ